MIFKWRKSLHPVIFVVQKITRPAVFLTGPVKFCQLPYATTDISASCQKIELRMKIQFHNFCCEVIVKLRGCDTFLRIWDTGQSVSYQEIFNIFEDWDMGPPVFSHVCFNGAAMNFGTDDHSFGKNQNQIW